MMSTLFMLIMMLAMIAFPVTVIVAVIKVIRKKCGKGIFKVCLIPLVAFMVATAGAVVTTPDMAEIKAVRLEAGEHVNDMDVGENEAIDVVVEPQNSDQKSLEYKSSDSQIAEFTDGKVTTKAKEGTVKIWAETKSGIKSNELEIRVRDHDKEVKEARAAKEKALKAEAEYKAKEKEAEEAKKAEEAAKKAAEAQAAAEAQKAAEARAAAMEAQNNQTNPIGETVLVTPTGSKYHNHKCGNGTYTPATLEEAQGRGLEPCKKCFG